MMTRHHIHNRKKKQKKNTARLFRREFTATNQLAITAVNRGQKKEEENSKRGDKWVCAQNHRKEDWNEGDGWWW